MIYNIGFVHYENRTQLLRKLESLFGIKKTFFISLSENMDYNRKFINISFGNFNENIIYTDIQLYNKSLKKKGFFLPDSNDKTELNMYQINELLLILQYYVHICPDLIKLMVKKLNI